MDLVDYLRVLRRNWILIVAAALAGLLAGGVVAVVTKPTYTAETQLFVAISSSGTVQELQQGNSFGQARVQSYVKMVDSPLVLQPAIDDLGIDVSAEALANRVEASTDLNTVLIGISVVDESPVQAAAIAQAVTNSLVRTVDVLEKPKAGGSSPVTLSITKPAKAPTDPSAPSTRLNLLIGLLSGLALGLAASVFRSTLDSKIRGEDDVRKVTDVPRLGGIFYDQDAAKKPLLTQAPPQSPRAEAYRQLRTNLQFANVTGRSKTLLVTSSLPGEGKSTTAINLAIAMGQAGQSVCLIDADLRRPMVSDYLGLDRNAGLTTALVGDADVNDLLQPWGENEFYVLASGQIPPNPSELLGSDAMKALLAGLEEAFDAVIIDAPPLLPVTDAAILAQSAGGVAVVVGMQSVRHHDLEKSLRALELVQANLLGVILNRLPSRGPDAYSYSYSYTSHPEEDANLRASSRSSTQRRVSRRAHDGPTAPSPPDDRQPSLFPLMNADNKG